MIALSLSLKSDGASLAPMFIVSVHQFTLFVGSGQGLEIRFRWKIIAIPTINLTNKGKNDFYFAERLMFGILNNSAVCQLPNLIT